MRRAAIDGQDPFETRGAGRGVLTLQALGETYIARYARAQKRSWREDDRKLRRDIFPVLGAVRADLVTKPDIVRLLDAIFRSWGAYPRQQNTRAHPQAVQLGYCGDHTYFFAGSGSLLPARLVKPVLRSVCYKSRAVTVSLHAMTVTSSLLARAIARLPVHHRTITRLGCATGCPSILSTTRGRCRSALATRPEGHQIHA